MIHGISNQTYRDLMLRFLPRPIATEKEYETTQQEVDRLIDKGDLSRDEQDYLDLLGTLISDFESRNENMEVYELRGVRLVKALLQLHNIKQQDLVSVFKTKSIVSAVLNGKRPLTAEHIDKLAAFFNVPHSLFFEVRS